MGTSVGEIELALVAKANEGDRDAVGRLYAMHASWVSRLAFRYTGDADDAEDVKHDTFIYLLSKFPGFTLRAPMRSFLFPAVRHRSFSLLRRRRRLRPLGADDSVIDRSQPAPKTGDWGRLLHRLPNHEQSVIELRFGRGLALLEISQELEIPLGTVKSRLHKAIARLRHEFSRAA